MGGAEKRVRAGFIGQALLKDLHKRYGDTALLYSTSRTYRFPSELWTWIQSDLTSVDSIRSVLHQTGAKTVFLPAASHFESTRKEAYKVNVDGTKTVIEACQQAGVKRLIYTSSCSVTWKGQDVYDGDENEPIVPEKEHVTYYAASKAIGEQIVISANGIAGMYTTAIRPSGLIG